MELTGSVGIRGLNRKADVSLVQEALNRVISVPYALLKVDGLIGPRTNEAIARFQRVVLKFQRPDSLIEKGGKTWDGLSLYLSQSKQQVASVLACPVPSSASKIAVKVRKIAWGAKVSPAFKNKVIQICKELEVSADFLMACMAFETGETFSPSIKNAAGSGATGLIQFMPATAKGMGTSTEALAKMSAVAQLDYVKKYFLPYRSRLQKLEDVYMAILYPAAIGKPVDHALFKEGRKTYSQNKGFDANKDGKITLSEISTKVRAKYEKGLGAGYIG
ncbi:hypothetical protein WKI13_04445 [Teredinibacter turnerae]|uniref:hypothetical protein n=1 Tax=Teredinibacter turnerae TaxID=2426 RepID=UPI000370DFBE|nr:hypothetical protein [Teredinibacter turnerae]